MIDYHINNDARRKFDFDSFVSHCKREPKAIERVAAAALSNPVGDFALELIFYSTIAKMVGASSTLIMYRINRPYKNFIAEMLAGISYATVNGNDPIYIDWFDVGYAAQILHAHPAWYENLFNMPDLVLFPSMRVHLAHLPTIVPLRIPEAKKSVLNETLVRHKISENRWFVVVHIREPNYQFRGADPERDADIATFRLAAERILAAGGQIVRIGHPGTTPLGIDGEIDLTNEPFDVQCYALSRARFNLLTDSGITIIASALMSPVLTVNGFGREHSFNSWDYTLLQRVKMTDGRVLNLNDREFGDRGFPDCDRRVWPLVDNNGLGKLLVPPFYKNTPREIAEAAEFMLTQTEEKSGWHTPRDPDPITVTGKFQLPLNLNPPKSQLFTPSAEATMD